MPIMIDYLSAISPTVTLAELYESQKHFVAAYAIYRYLFLKKKGIETETAMNEMEKKAFMDSGGNVLTGLQEIFTPGEASRLGIFASEHYTVLREVLDDLLNRDTTELDIIDDEEEHLFSSLEQKISSEWRQILSSERNNVKEKSEQSLSIDKINWSEIKLSDFIGFLVSLGCDDKTLDRLRLSEIMELFLSHYRDNDDKK